MNSECRHYSKAQLVMHGLEKHNGDETPPHLWTFPDPYDLNQRADTIQGESGGIDWLIRFSFLPGPSPRIYFPAYL